MRATIEHESIQHFSWDNVLVAGYASTGCRTSFVTRDTGRRIELNGNVITTTRSHCRILSAPTYEGAFVLH